MAYLNGSYKIWTNVNQSNFIWWPQGKRKYWDRLHNWIASIRILNTRLQVIHYWLLLFRMVTKGWITTNMNQVTTNLTMPRLTLFFYHCVSDFIFWLFIVTNWLIVVIHVSLLIVLHFNQAIIFSLYYPTNWHFNSWYIYIYISKKVNL